jgi:hypothetical protein
MDPKRPSTVPGRSLVRFWKLRDKTQVNVAASRRLRLFGFTETQLPSMDSDPVTEGHAFVLVNTSVSSPPITCTIKSFPCIFVTTLRQTYYPDVLALVLTKDCFLTSRGVIISEHGIFCENRRCKAPGRLLLLALHFNELDVLEFWDAGCSSMAAIRGSKFEHKCPDKFHIAASQWCKDGLPLFVWHRIFAFQTAAFSSRKSYGSGGISLWSIISTDY